MAHRFNQGVEISIENSDFKTDMELRAEVQNKYGQKYSKTFKCS